MQRYWKIFLHLVWSTHNRSHLIRGEAERRLHRGIRTRARELELVPICVNSAWNHTHSLLSWNPKMAPDRVVEELKDGGHTAWASLRKNSDDLQLPELRWQEGYAGFSVSPGRVDSVKTYVAHQKRLHRNGDTVDHFETWATAG